MGRTDSGFYWTIIRIIATSIAIYIGAQFSVEAIALSLLVLNFVVNPLFWRITIKPLIGGSYGGYFRVSLFVCLVVMVVSSPLYFFFHSWTMVLPCILIGLLYSVIYAFVVLRFCPDAYVVRVFKEKVLPKLKKHIGK